MHSRALLHVLDRLDAGFDPTTQRPFDQETSCLSQPAVTAALTRLRGALQHISDHEGAELPDSVLRETTEELISLGYRPTVEQIGKVLRASRSIADPTLKAVSGYGRYRNRLSKRFLLSTVKAFTERHPELFARPSRAGQPATVKKARVKKDGADHQQNPFFRENHFDKLSDEKAAELKLEIQKLGLARPTDKLPEFKKRARVNYPRAYEPWSRPEQALLIEAMCYTNDAEKIAGLFGRTAKSITETGLKLIHQSRRA